MHALPLIRTDTPNLTPMEQSALNCETLITALMTAGTLNDLVDSAEREVYTLLLTAVIFPAEA
jgi:hypothetical protein